MNVAITGGIGSGKSYVCALLKQQGIDVYDCDSAAKRIMRQSADVRDRLVKLLGQDAYVDGLPNKARIASYILASAENAAKVNAIIHPAVAEDFVASGYGFMECAILFTSGFDKLVDKVVCVAAPLDVRLRRIMSRDSISLGKAREWIECQMSQEEMIRRSDYVVLNDGETDLNSELRRLLKEIEDKQ